MELWLLFTLMLTAVGYNLALGQERGCSACFGEDQDPVCTKAGVTLLSACLATCQGLRIARKGFCQGERLGSRHPSIRPSIHHVSGARVSLSKKAIGSGLGQGPAHKCPASPPTAAPAVPRKLADTKNAYRITRLKEFVPAARNATPSARQLGALKQPQL